MNDISKQMAEWGRKGGRARAESLSQERRKEIASLAGKAPRAKRESQPEQEEVRPQLTLDDLHPEFSRRLQNGLIPATPDEIQDLLSKSQDDLISIWRSIRTGQAKALGEALQGE